LPDREAAADWIDANQLGRRNLTRDQANLLRGRRYNRAKKANGVRGPQKLDQNDPASTADRLGKQHGVSAPTIKRDAKFAAEQPDVGSGASAAASSDGRGGGRQKAKGNLPAASATDHPHRGWKIFQDGMTIPVTPLW